MKLIVINSKAKYDMDCEPKVVMDDVVGGIVIGRRAAIPMQSLHEERAIRLIENLESLNIEEVISVLGNIRGVFVGEASKLEEVNRCWRLMRLAGKLIERPGLTSSWCACIGLTNDSINKRVAFERIPTPELALSGNVVVGVSLFNLKCNRIEFRDIPLVKFDKPKPPQSLVDIMASMIESSVGDVVANLEAIIEDVGRRINDLIKAKLKDIEKLIDEALREGVAYVEFDKLADEIFNDICKGLGSHMLSIKEEAKRRLMI